LEAIVLYKKTVLLQGLKVDKTKSSASPPPRLLDANIQRLRYMHYSLRTDQAYVYWVRYFVRWGAFGIGNAARSAATSLLPFFGEIDLRTAQPCSPDLPVRSCASPIRGHPSDGWRFLGVPPIVQRMVGSGVGPGAQRAIRPEH
jgi:hypothetical protein